MSGLESFIENTLYKIQAGDKRVGCGSSSCFCLYIFCDCLYYLNHITHDASLTLRVLSTQILVRLHLMMLVTVIDADAICINSKHCLNIIHSA